MDSSENITKEEGLRLLKAGQIEDAIAVMVKVAGKKPDDPQIQSYLGVAYNQKGDRMRAVHAFEESLRLEETPKAYFNLGLAYESSNRLEEAVRQYEMALSLDANYTQAQQGLEKLRAQFEAKQQALIQAQAAQSPSPAMAGAGVAPEPTLIGSAPPMIGGAPNRHVQQAPQSKNGPPDPIIKQIEEQKKLIEQQKLMTRSGLIYGTLCGAGFLFLIRLSLGIFLAPVALMLGGGKGLVISILMGLVQGAILGAIIGYWVGHTCNGESAGFQAGAAVGSLWGLVNGLIGGLGPFALVTSFLSAIVIGIFGWLVGRMVDASIGWD